MASSDEFAARIEQRLLEIEPSLCELFRAYKVHVLAEQSCQVIPSERSSTANSATPAQDFAEDEEGLRASEERFRTMANCAPVMIWVSAPDKLCTFFNTPWLQFRGRTLQEEIGDGWADGVHPDDLSLCLDIYTTAFEAREQFRMEYRLKRFDGIYRWILDTGTPLYGQAGDFCGYIGSCIDVTDHKELEHKLTRLNEGLEERVRKRTMELAELNVELQVARDQALEASNLKSEFVANISHELRTPLSAVIGVGELLLTEPLTELQQSMVTTIQSSAQGLLAVVNDLLDIAKMEANKLELESVPFNAIDLVQECTKLFANAAQNKQLSLTSQLDQRVPELVLGDPVRIRQILMNLIGNALKFTSTGGVSVKIGVFEQTPQDVTLLFEVHDTGVGVDLAKNLLFSPFSQGKTARKHGGTGLGLAISKRLTELMGGCIGCKSLPEQGSMFWFRVPFKKLTHAVERPLEVVSGRKINSQSVVLVVEDNPVLQKLAAHQLAYIGIRCVAVASGYEAVEEVKRSSFDLILMDCSLPDITGFEATRLIREWEGGKPRIPIIAVTALAMSSDAKRCLAAGMDDYLAKPVSLSRLREKVELWLAEKQERPSPVVM